MVLDTGAQVSVIKSAAANRLGLQITDEVKSLYSFDGQKLNIVGTVSADITWHNQTKNVRLYVINFDSPHDGLLWEHHDILQQIHLFALEKFCLFGVLKGSIPEGSHVDTADLWSVHDLT